jgi:hypothetical protein
MRFLELFDRYASQPRRPLSAIGRKPKEEWVLKHSPYIYFYFLKLVISINDIKKLFEKSNKNVDQKVGIMII